MVEKKVIIDKKFIPTLIALGTLILLAIFILPSLGPSQIPLSNEKDLIINADLADLDSIVILTPDSKEINIDLKLQKNGDWFVNGKLAYFPEIQRIFSVLKTIQITKTIDKYGNLKDFGLEPPKKILGLRFKDKEKKDDTYYIGDFAPASKDRYVRIPGFSRIYMVQKEIYTALSMTPQGLVNKDIFTMEPDEVQTFSITQNNKTYRMVKEDGGWYVTLPSELTLYADQNKVSNIINNLFGNSAMAVVTDDGTDISEYDLEKPAIKMTASSKDGHKANVLISDVIPSTKLRYITNRLTNRVFVIQNDKVQNNILFNNLDIRNKKIIVPKLSELAKIEITIEKKKYVFKVDEFKLWHCNQLKQEEIDTTDFIEGLTSHYVDITSDIDIKKSKEDFGFDKPIIQINCYEKNKYKEKDYKPYSVRIGKKSKEGVYYIEKTNDPYLYFITQSTLDFIKHMGEKTKETKDDKENKETKKEE